MVFPETVFLWIINRRQCWWFSLGTISDVKLSKWNLSCEINTLFSRETCFAMFWAAQMQYSHCFRFAEEPPQKELKPFCNTTSSMWVSTDLAEETLCDDHLLTVSWKSQVRAFRASHNLSWAIYKKISETLRTVMHSTKQMQCFNNFLLICEMSLCNKSTNLNRVSCDKYRTKYISHLKSVHK